MFGLIAGYLATRTIGFPGFRGDWNDLGITAVAMELIIAGLLFATCLPRCRHPADNRSTRVPSVLDRAAVTEFRYLALLLLDPAEA